MSTKTSKTPSIFKRKKRTLLLWAGSMLLLFILLTAAMVHHALQPLDTEGKTRTFQVKEGATLNQVAVNLEKAGIIPNSTLFRLAGRLKGYDQRIKTGEYRLNSAMAPLKILEILEKGRTITYSITIPEGFRLTQIADLLEQKGLIDKTSFLEQAQDKSLVESLGFSGDTLEGYLYPDTYRFGRNEKASRIIGVMVNRFRDIVAPLEAQIKDSGMTLRQVITLASIVEKETGQPEERPMIARVFLNRLRKNMRLESDPTVIYGISNFDGNLTRKDLKTKTAYNTYVINGLPPGPISNPGLAAIEAVLNPADGDYCYFVSKNNGTHYFSETLREHNRAVRRFQKNRHGKQG